MSITSASTIFFYNEQEGYLETFRPYALPAGEWIDEAGRNLSRLALLKA